MPMTLKILLLFIIYCDNFNTMYLYMNAQNVNTYTKYLSTKGRIYILYEWMKWKLYVVHTLVIITENDVYITNKLWNI